MGKMLDNSDEFYPATIRVVPPDYEHDNLADGIAWEVYEKTRLIGRFQSSFQAEEFRKAVSLNGGKTDGLY